MTNGEKMKIVFPDIKMWGESKDTLDYSLGGMIHSVTKSWWNAEYKEPTTKNDLGVLDQIRAEIETLNPFDYGYHRSDMLDMVLGVIDKYRNEVSK